MKQADRRRRKNAGAGETPISPCLFLSQFVPFSKKKNKNKKNKKENNNWQKKKKYEKETKLPIGFDWRNTEGGFKHFWKRKK